MKIVLNLSGVFTVRTRYRTKQQDELLAYLRSRPHVQVTVNDIVQHFSSCSISVGTATIYRHLEQMVSDGTVKKYFVDGISGACFEYVGESAQAGEPSFHLKCEQCGKLVQFRCTELAQMQQHLLKHHGFSINSPKTVFYGLCSQCTHRKP